MHYITRTNYFCGPSLKMLIVFGLKRKIKAVRDENWAFVTPSLPAPLVFTNSDHFKEALIHSTTQKPNVK